ncbi:MAG: hypothetical protein HXS41_11225 [Theionarchaea archaeon]|nr:hypothetical protein [Theionarchaea archaeon]MBU7000841.1 hypothetical protein [Theionarchaea archaeon]MBU7021618.1 hypothetical protein [Theionarchaea archaeon]MBU7034919.1 hypothetical protein [Theionarchaea archaeon]MBU7039395.1 hypothetical protein [Theionarchaea archaeon]
MIVGAEGGPEYLFYTLNISWEGFWIVLMPQSICMIGPYTWTEDFHLRLTARGRTKEFVLEVAKHSNNNLF